MAWDGFWIDGFEWRQTSFLFFKNGTRPFLRDFLYISRKLLDVFFDAEYKTVVSISDFFLFYAILMSYSFALGFRTLERPLQCLQFCFYSKQRDNIICFYLYTSITTTTAILCSMENSFPLRNKNKLFERKVIFVQLIYSITVFLVTMFPLIA